MELRTIKEADFKDKKVLIRVDFNVPLDDSNNITDDKRIKAALPTIQYVLDNGAKQVILMSHLGKPKGAVVEKLKVNPVAARLSELLAQDIKKMDDCINDSLPEDKIILLENLRFHAEEKKDDEEFAKKLASLADIYVNDAFGTCHRAHASVHAITKFLDSYAGLLVEKEISIMGKAIENPEKPFIAIMGGVKVSDKIEVINNLLGKVDGLLVGGAMIFTFYKALGLEIGKSIVEEDKVGLAKELKEKNKKLVLPTDVVIAEMKSDELNKTELADADSKIVPVDKIPAGFIGLDIGEKTIKDYKEVIANAKTIIWNGPMGMFEIEKFAVGTKEIAQAVADATQKGAVTIIGGGDSAAAIDQLGLSDKVTHVSTGGGASLDFFAGKTLPGIEVLKK